MSLRVRAAQSSLSFSIHSVAKAGRLALSAGRLYPCETLNRRRAARPAPLQASGQSKRTFLAWMTAAEVASRHGKNEESGRDAMRWLRPKCVSASARSDLTTRCRPLPRPIGCAFTRLETCLDAVSSSEREQAANVNRLRTRCCVAHSGQVAQLCRRNLVSSASEQVLDVRCACNSVLTVKNGMLIRLNPLTACAGQIGTQFHCTCHWCRVADGADFIVAARETCARGIVGAPRALIRRRRPRKCRRRVQARRCRNRRRRSARAAHSPVARDRVDRPRSTTRRNSLR